MPRPFDRVNFTYTGSGAAQTVTLGFKPSFIIAVNETDGDTTWYYMQGMADATAFAIALATAPVASQGCTLTNTGFTLGTDAVINESGKAYRGVAFV